MNQRFQEKQYAHRQNTNYFRFNLLPTNLSYYYHSAVQYHTQWISRSPGGHYFQRRRVPNRRIKLSHPEESIRRMQTRKSSCKGRSLPRPLIDPTEICTVTWKNRISNRRDLVRSIIFNHKYCTEYFALEVRSLCAQNSACFSAVLGF